MAADRYYAHSLPEPLTKANWEPLEEHLRLVATGRDDFPGAAGFAKAFGAEDWGRLLGYWHDLGKYSAEFQAYLLSSPGCGALTSRAGRVDHSTAGAQHAMKHLPVEIGRIIAHCIAGHHSGLLDDEAGGIGETGLSDRLKKQVPTYDAAPREILELRGTAIPRQMDFLTTRSDQAFRISVFCRMLFSCLVDADYLATEAFMSPERSAARPQTAPSMHDLRDILNVHLERLHATKPATPINQRRREVLACCRDKAALPPGLFSLTVPTGGGKTLSSLAFALEHAAQHGLRRVIYAIPFTSIIEQNADVFREVFAVAGDGIVLEHHSNFEGDASREPVESETQTPRHRLASENWDAPLVITTNVQLLESLFANRTSRCRKLHCIAGSVIILDEVQSLPVELLRPTLAMLQELCRNYGCAVVLCSATQPAVQKRDDFRIGLDGVREIVDDKPGLFNSLRRVAVARRGSLEDDALAAELSQCAQVLCIVNTRGHAAGLFNLLRSRGVQHAFHLSAQMCPAHRTRVLDIIRGRLAARQPCRVISTQLIEAGVDIDFPVVYRAMAGLDSIAQAAGRCNREGLLHRGQLHLFEPEVIPPMFKAAAQETREVADLCDDLMGLEAIEEFFRLHYWRNEPKWDRHDVMKCFQQANTLQFRTAADAYKLIRDEQLPVVVPYEAKGRALVEELRRMEFPPSRAFLRKLQRFTVNLHERQFKTLFDNKAAVMCHECCVLMNSEAYDDDLGLKLDVIGFGALESVV